MNKIVMQKPEAVTVAEACEQFLQACRIKNLSPATVTDYEVLLEPLLRLYGGRRIDKIGRGDIDAYIQQLTADRPDLRPTSMNTYLRALRAFLYWASEEYGLPRVRVRLQMAEKTPKETYTEEELAVLLAEPDKRACSFAEYKTWAFENFLLGTGCRLRTALNVKIGDIDFNNGYITLTTQKNRKPQIIPLSHALADVLAKYLQVRGGEDDDFLFCTDRGEQGTVKGFQTLVWRYNKRRGVEKTSCHAFRHTFARSWVVSGGDVFRLQKILGHSDLTVTREYVDLWGQDLKTGFESHNPLDAIKGSGGSGADIIRMPRQRRNRGV